MFYFEEKGSSLTTQEDVKLKPVIPVGKYMREGVWTLRKSSLGILIVLVGQKAARFRDVLGHYKVCYGMLLRKLSTLKCKGEPESLSVL
jgi:hypothetical protein